MNKDHTAEFIEEMKVKLLEEKEEIQKELSEIAEKSHGDYQAKYPEYGRHEDENASEIADLQSLAGVTEANEERVESINKALKKIEEGTYGVTDAGEIIPIERLRANPAADSVIQ